MGFSVAVWGRAHLPPEGMAAWRRSRVDAASFDDWTGDFGPPFPRGPTTVGKHLARWKKDDALEYKMTKSEVSLRGILDEDTYRDACAELAAAFRAAAPHGGRGELVFFGIGEDVSCVVSVEDGESCFRDVPERPEWKRTIDGLLAESRGRFEDTSIGKAMQKEKQANEAAARELAARTEAALALGPLDDAGLEALFHALEPRGDFYNPYEEPTKSAMARLLGIDDERVARWALARLAASWSELAVLTGIYCMNLVALLVRHRCREARALLLQIHGTESARFDLRAVAARALLEIATDAEIETVYGASRDAMVAEWNRPNVTIDRSALRRLATFSA